MFAPSPYSSNSYGLRPDQLYEAQTAFHQFDGNHNGFITADEMRACLQRFNIRFSDYEVQRVLAQMDFNRDGQISYDEYMNFMRQLYQRGY